MANGRRIGRHASSRSRNRLMASTTMADHSLPAEAKALIWRIFGAGESPLTRLSAYKLIEPIMIKHLSSTNQDRAIAEIRGWFESHDDQRWLKPDMSESVAVLILEEVKTECSETAIWAIGSIDADLAARVIRSRWSSQEIASVVEAMLTTLEKLCSQDEVLDATRCAGFVAQDSIKANIPKSAVEREGRLETFRYINNRGFELVHHGLHNAVGNLIELVIELHPEQFESLIERLDHPVVQARAAHCMIAAALPMDHRETLRWITENSCDALVALAIMSTLNTVNELDEELRLTDRLDVDQYSWSTELRPSQDDLNAAAASLLADLVNRLAVLDPLACARWIGELLSAVPYVLHRHVLHRRDGEKPRRIEQLEKACTDLLARLVRQSWSEGLLVELRAGLCLTPRMTWTRHVAAVAWAIRDVAPTRAAEIARVTLDEHERHIAEQLKQDRLFLDWSDWHDREWMSGLGIALALSHEELDLPKWVSARCRPLPLSVWDAEENAQAFITADRAVQHWFLIAFLAIPRRRDLGGTIDPAAVRALAETLWAHCHFVGDYFHSHPEASVAAEYAARIAAEFGELSDVWLLNQARVSGVGPCTLWALIDTRGLKSAREGGMHAQYDEMITTEFVRIASDRFGDGGQFDLDALRSWGQLWFLLDAIDEAEQTALAISAFPLREYDRVEKILLLKLLALVASKRKLAPTVEDDLVSLYRQLWPGHTPSEERVDRQQIDELLKRSQFSIL